MARPVGIPSHKKRTPEEFVRLAQEQHPTYDFSMTKYVDSTVKVDYSCGVEGHGVRSIAPAKLLNGQGCALCKNDKLSQKFAFTQDQFLAKVNSVPRAGPELTYDNAVYVNQYVKVKVTCAKHGEFEIQPAKLFIGQGCAICGTERGAALQTRTNEEFISLIEAAHPGVYDYSKTKYTGAQRFVTLTCKKHGDIEFLADNILNAGKRGKGNGCAKCFYEKAVLTQDDFIQRASEVHNNKYDYSQVKYTKSVDHVDITCPTHGLFSQKAGGHLYNNAGCPKCLSTYSKMEEEVRDYVESLGVKTRRHRLAYGKHIDMLCYDLNIGIEFNGIYWHSEKYRGKDYHLIKFEEANKEGIKLIQIFEDEWRFIKDLVKNRLRNILGVSEKIYARKTEVVELPWSEAKSFLEETHVQGGQAELQT